MGNIFIFLQNKNYSIMVEKLSQWYHDQRCSYVSTSAFDRVHISLRKRKKETIMIIGEANAAIILNSSFSASSRRTTATAAHSNLGEGQRRLGDRLQQSLIKQIKHIIGAA